MFQWIIRIVFLLLQLSPVLRYIDTLVYGIRSKIAASTDEETKRIVLYRRMLDEDTNSALLRLFHCFLHAAPQAVIQLVILLRHNVQQDKIQLNFNDSCKYFFYRIIQFLCLFLFYFDISI